MQLSSSHLFFLREVSGHLGSFLIISDQNRVLWVFVLERRPLHDVTSYQIYSFGKIGSPNVTKLKSSKSLIFLDSSEELCEYTWVLGHGLWFLDCCEIRPEYRRRATYRLVHNSQTTARGTIWIQHPWIDRPPRQR